MTRIAEITSREALPEEKRAIYDAIGDSRGAVRGPFALLLHSPEVAGRTAHLGTFLRFESSLTATDRELAIITAAREADCAYEWAAHVRLAREVGVPEAAIDAVANKKTLDGLAPDEALVVGYARELLRDHRVSQATFDKVRARYGDQTILELTATLGYYTMLACTLNAFEARPAADAPQLPM
jgi:4-carboxymuconolactone decarboxylase